jgi:hypothetical protein
LLLRRVIHRHPLQGHGQDELLVFLWDIAVASHGAVRYKVDRLLTVVAVGYVEPKCSIASTLQRVYPKRTWGQIWEGAYGFEFSWKLRRNDFCYIEKTPIISPRRVLKCVDELEFFNVFSREHLTSS